MPSVRAFFFFFHYKTSPLYKKIHLFLEHQPKQSVSCSFSNYLLIYSAKSVQPEVHAGLNNNNEFYRRLRASSAASREMSEVKPGKTLDADQAWIAQRQVYANNFNPVDDRPDLSNDTLEVHKLDFGLDDRSDYVLLVHLIRY